MTAKLLTLKSCKTEFFAYWTQKATCQNAQLFTWHLLLCSKPWLLGFIFDEHLTFSDQITSLSKACYYQIRQLRCIWRDYGLTSIRELPVQLLLLSFTPSLITVILSVINSPLYPISSRSSTLLLVLSVKLPSHVTSLPSYMYAHSTGSETLNASNKRSSHLGYLQSSHNYPNPHLNLPYRIVSCHTENLLKDMWFLPMRADKQTDKQA